jgi:hypothetical protein
MRAIAAWLLLCTQAMAGQPALMPAASSAAPGSGPAAACRAAIAAAEAQTRIPDAFLSAIGRVESGRPIAGMGLSPWPWTINADGAGHFYNTKAEAVAAARGFIAAGVKSIDAGCLQVSLLYHPEAFASLEDAFDPTLNASFAAKFLLSLFQRERSWPRAAAAYHSQTPVLGQDYQQKVLAAWALPDGEAPAATPSGHAGTPPAAATAGIEPGGTAAGAPAPVAAFGHSVHLAGATAPVSTGRSLAAYRAFPVMLARAGFAALPAARGGVVNLHK